MAAPDPNLRILIFSTPKTGNTWLRHLLAGIYRLPQYYVPPPIDGAKLSGAGERWVTHYHTRPTPELLGWICAQRPVVVTTIRHPGDVLISLYHHVRGFGSGTIDPDFLRRMLTAGFERANMTTDSAGQPFSADLACSIEWMHRQGTHVVRYEDLRADTAGTLRDLTARICPVPDERIEAAIEMCDIDQMRNMAGGFGGFFRGGRVGAWRDLLPPDVAETLRAAEPYAGQLAALGYSMDPHDPLISRGIEARRRHPMAALRQFANGVPVAPMLVQCFFWSRREQRALWEKQLDGTGPGSFYEWMNAPCPEGGRGIYEGLAVSNLAAFIYGQRPDLRLAYPGLTSRGRYDYLRWFLRSAGGEHGLDAAFLNPVRAALLRWANAAARPDAAGASPATNFVLHICGTLTDVLGSFPHIRGRERRALVRAVLRTAQALRMDAEYTVPLERSLGRHWLPRSLLRRLGLYE
jgi:hypothetical protein